LLWSSGFFSRLIWFVGLGVLQILLLISWGELKLNLQKTLKRQHKLRLETLKLRGKCLEPFEVVKKSDVIYTLFCAIYA
jgi:hypothetical protein